VTRQRHARLLQRHTHVDAQPLSVAQAQQINVDLRRHTHVDLLRRTWELRDNFTSYDPMYVALAEAIDSPLVTCDGPLGSAPGHTVRVEVIR
jgi:predicted nucleic acid-binding protein